jgi:hypothetical protein
VGEQSAVVWKLVYFKPASTRRCKVGISIKSPKGASCPKPVSSMTQLRMLGAPAVARTGWGQAGLDSSIVRPIMPSKRSATV